MQSKLCYSGIAGVARLVSHSSNLEAMQIKEE
jgi:hypothetical protein